MPFEADEIATGPGFATGSALRKSRPTSRNESQPAHDLASSHDARRYVDELQWLVLTT